jgi:hypothetical protein
MHIYNVYIYHVYIYYVYTYYVCIYIFIIYTYRSTGAAAREDACPPAYIATAYWYKSTCLLVQKYCKSTCSSLCPGMLLSVHRCAYVTEATVVSAYISQQLTGTNVLAHWYTSATKALATAIRGLVHLAAGVAGLVKCYISTCHCDPRLVCACARDACGACCRCLCHILSSFGRCHIV